MIGLLECLLTERYGDPRIVGATQFVEYRWNEENEPCRCLLYKADVAARGCRPGPGVLGEVYGDALGGVLLLDSLKVAMLSGPPVYGLYALDELHAQPEVRDASQLDPEIQFFMDAANVWFYGVKDQELHVYDSEATELTCLGPFRPAFQEILQEWEQAASR